MSSYTFKQCTRADETKIVDFLVTIKDELLLPDREAISNMMAFIFAHGGVIAAYDNDKLCGMLGFFYGEPAHEFSNRHVAFLYVAGIAPQYRLSRVFHKGLLFALRELQAMGLREIRMQAEAVNPYTNKLYARFADFLYPDKTLRGVPVNTYGGSIDAALTRLGQRRRPVARQTKSVPVAAYA